MSDNTLKFVAPFVKSTRETFKTMVQTEVKLKDPVMYGDTPLPTNDITAFIGMSGTRTENNLTKEFRGLLALSFHEHVYVKLASRMIMEEHTEYGPDIADTGAELCNIILGQSKAELAQFGLKLGLTSPSTVRGKDHQLKYPYGGTVLGCSVSCDAGDFLLFLCYQDIN